MGITGLLPFLKKSSRHAHVKEFKGETVAVDTYCWLHKGAFSCAEKLAKGEPTTQYVSYCMSLVNLLLDHGLKPIMVFDGRRLPAKKETEAKRRENRDANRNKAAQALRDGNASLARIHFERSIDVTSQMALELMRSCRAIGVDCINAPYEADAQLAYLNVTGIAQLVISEDSDLIPFGCDRVLFKLDKAGNGILVERKELGASLPLDNGFTLERFRWACILSGCDYLASLPGIGLAKAFKLFQRCSSPDPRVVLKKIPIVLNMHKIKVPEEYVEGFVRADQTFLHQLVFDPRTRRLLPLTPIPESIVGEDLRFAGETMEPWRAWQLALGNLDCNSLEIIFDFDPDDPERPSSFSSTQVVNKKSKNPAPLPPPPLSRSSIWHKEFEPGRDWRRIIAEEMGEAKREAESKVPSLLTTNAKAKKSWLDSSKKEDIKRSVHVSSSGVPSIKSSFINTSPRDAKLRRSEGGISLKRRRSESEEDAAKILAGYGANSRLDSLKGFAKDAGRKKMNWGGIPPENSSEGEERVLADDLSAGSLFKRRKIAIENNTEPKLIASRSPVVPSTVPSVRMSEMPSAVLSSAVPSAAPEIPTPETSPVDSDDESYQTKNPLVVSASPSPSLSPSLSQSPSQIRPVPPTVFFRKSKIQAASPTSWRSIQRLPEPEVEVRSRFFHPAPRKTPDDGREGPEAPGPPEASVEGPDDAAKGKALDSTPDSNSTPKRTSFFSWRRSNSFSSTEKRRTFSSPKSPSLSSFLKNSPSVGRPFKSVAKRTENGTTGEGGGKEEEEEIKDEKKEAGIVDAKAEENTEKIEIDPFQKENLRETKSVKKDGQKDGQILTDEQKEGLEKDSSFLSSSPYFSRPAVAPPFVFPARKGNATTTKIKTNNKRTSSKSTQPISAFFKRK